MVHDIVVYMYIQRPNDSSIGCRALSIGYAAQLRPLWTAAGKNSESG